MAVLSLGMEMEDGVKNSLYREGNHWDRGGAAGREWRENKTK